MKATQSFFQRHGFTIFVVVALLALYLYFKPKEQLPAFLVHTPQPTHVGAPLVGQDEFNESMDEFLQHAGQTRWIHVVGNTVDGTLDLTNQWLTTVEDWKTGFLLNGNGVHVADWLPNKPLLIIVPIAAGNGFAIQRILDHVLAKDVPITNPVRIVFISPKLPPSLAVLASKEKYQTAAHQTLTPAPLTEQETDAIASGLWAITKGSRSLVSLAMQEIEEHGALQSESNIALLEFSKAQIVANLGDEYHSNKCSEMMLLSALTHGFDKDDVRFINPPPSDRFAINNKCKPLGKNEHSFTASVSPALLNNYIILSELNKRADHSRESNMHLAWALRPEEVRFSLSSILQFNPTNTVLPDEALQPQPGRADNWQYWLGIYTTVLDDSDLPLADTQALFGRIKRYEPGYIVHENEFCFGIRNSREEFIDEICEADKDTGDHGTNAAAIHAAANAYTLAAMNFKRLGSLTDLASAQQELDALLLLLPNSLELQQRIEQAK